MSARILRFPRSDAKGSDVLVQVKANGSKPLDLKLIGTEGIAPYHVALRHIRVGDLKDKKSPGSKEEWEEVLKSIFLGEGPVEDIEATAVLESESFVAIKIRRGVQGITQALGTITLKYDEDKEVELFEWCSTALEARDRLKKDLDAANVKVRGLEAAVHDLTSQLNEFIAAKQTDESALLEKFRDLLNEKKVKIREQQRILATANVDPDKVAAASQAKTAGFKARSKRKAAAAISGDSSDDDDCEKMDVDADVKEEPRSSPSRVGADRQDDEEEEEEQETTSAEDEATASEADEIAEEVIAPRTRGAARGGHPKSISPQEPGPAGKAKARRQGRPKQTASKATTPPPRRNLPFGLGKGKASAKPTALAAGEGSETESDFEL